MQGAWRRGQHTEDAEGPLVEHVEAGVEGQVGHHQGGGAGDRVPPGLGPIGRQQRGLLIAPGRLHGSPPRLGAPHAGGPGGAIRRPDGRPAARRPAPGPPAAPIGVWAGAQLRDRGGGVAARGRGAGARGAGDGASYPVQAPKLEFKSRARDGGRPAGI